MDVMIFSTEKLPIVLASVTTGSAGIGKELPWEVFPADWDPVLPAPTLIHSERGDESIGSSFVTRPPLDRVWEFRELPAIVMVYS